MAPAGTAHHIIAFETVPRLSIPVESPVTLSLLDNVTGAPPRQATQVTVARDSERLHVTFGCEDAEPWATITRRDGPLYEEEVVEVFLDPFADLECYFEIEVNPLNSCLDLVLRRVGKGWRKEFAWTCEGLETSASRTEAGWNATLAIPFSALIPQPPVPGDIWRANFFRIDRPAGFPRELSAWSPTGLHTFHAPRHFGYLEF